MEQRYSKTEEICFSLCLEMRGKRADFAFTTDSSNTVKTNLVVVRVVFMFHKAPKPKISLAIFSAFFHLMKNKYLIAKQNI